MQVISKKPLSFGTNKLLFPKDSKILCVKAQAGLPYIYGL